MSDDAEIVPASIVGGAPEFADELDEAIIAGVIADDAAFAGWVPSSVGQAEWAMVRLSALRARANEVDRQAREYTSRVGGWKTAELKRITPGLSFFERALKAYGIARRAETKEATALLPSGYVSTRGSKQPTIDVDNEAVVAEWAGEHLSEEAYDAVVKLEPKVLISQLRKIVQAVDADLHVCDECHSAIEEPEPGVWRHVVDHPEDEPHDAVPMKGYKVVLVATGEVVPGLIVTAPHTTASVVVAR